MQVTDAATTLPNGELHRWTVVEIRFVDRTVRVKPRPRGMAEDPFPELPGTVGAAALHVVTACDLNAVPPSPRTTSAPRSGSSMDSTGEGSRSGPQREAMRTARTSGRASPWQV